MFWSSHVEDPTQLIRSAYVRTPISVPAQWRDQVFAMALILIEQGEGFGIASTGLAGVAAGVVVHRPQRVNFAYPAAASTFRARRDQESAKFSFERGRVFRHADLITRSPRKSPRAAI